MGNVWIAVSSKLHLLNSLVQCTAFALLFFQSLVQLQVLLQSLPVHCTVIQLVKLP